MTTSGRSIALVCTGVRKEERMLVSAFAERDVDLSIVDDRTLYGALGSWPNGLPRVDAVLLRAKSQWRNIVLARWLEGLGVPVVNSSSVIETCGDKVLTTLALLGANVPTLTSAVAFSVEAGLKVSDEVGFPLVVKPTVGSWGRLVGRVNDQHALETVLEHKEAVGGAPHAASYLQEYVESGGRDIRSFVIDGHCVAAIARTSDHWRTNTALGAEATGVEVDARLEDISVQAARSVGGGAVAVDLFERDGAYVVNEVNGTMEFRNSVTTTGVDIPGLMAEYVLRVVS
jgi:[lysine-biosynthesis-protein LysW]--L-2-aminoadipate ligase